MKTYESGFGQRWPRRRLLQTGAAGGLAAAAAALVGCGGGSSEEGDASGSAGISKLEDTSRSARSGGVYRGYVTADARGFDPHVNNTGTSALVTDHVYSRLTQFAPGLNGQLPSATVIPEFAESWEFTADRLQLTYKLRGDVKLDPRTPTSGRVLDAQDVVKSWERFATLHPFRVGLSNAASKDAPILSVQAVDARTVVIKLAFESQELLSDLSRGSQRLLIAPREADGGFDPRNEIRGSSAWTLAEYQASARLTFAKNPDWYRKDRPFVDKWDLPIISEYSQRLAQFRSGGVFEAGIRQEDVLQTKKDLPQLAMYTGEFSATVEPTIRFGLGTPDAPFWDQRVRQAFSMLIDRETWIRIFGAVEQFEAAGFQVRTGWMTHASVEGGISPLDKDFGPNAKYYMLNIPEAKKLLAAAGYADGLTTDALYRSDGQAVFSQWDALVGMLAEGGIKSTIKVTERGEWTDKVRNGRGDWSGYSFDLGGASPSVASFLWRRYGSGGTVFAGFDPAGKDRLRGDPKVDDLTNKMIREADTKKRQSLIDEFLRYMAGTMYEVPAGGQASGFRLVWPTVKNFGVFRAILPAIESDIHIWLDPSLAPTGTS
jgi:peptide/nickel transport system substrate-binding protein